MSIFMAQGLNLAGEVLLAIITTYVTDTYEYVKIMINISTETWDGVPVIGQNLFASVNPPVKC